MVVCLYGFTNTQFTTKEFVMTDKGNRVISQLMEKALQCVEEYTEIEVTINNGNEQVIIDYEDKFIWNYRKKKL